MLSLNAARRCLCISNALALAVLLVFAPQSPAEEKIRVAAISFEPQKFDLAGNARRLEQLFRDAQRGGARIAVAPEGALDGYVVNEIIAGTESAERMKDVAITIDGPVIGQFQKLAKELRMCLAFGFAERIGDDVYNSAVFIDHAGQLCGNYHKMQLAEGYDESWWFNRLGDKCRAFDTPFGRCGILICNDRWNPQLAKITALDGAQFLVIPSFGSTSEKQDEAVLSRSVENSIPVIEANVGVTLIVSENRIAAVDRAREHITFSEIVIPDARPVNATMRDEEEQRFLMWRTEEMPKRLAKHRPPEVGDAARKLELKNFDTGTVQLDEAIDKGPVVVVVLRGNPGYQCPLCTRQVGQFISAAKDFRTAGATVILVYPGPAAELEVKAEEFLKGTILPEGFHLVTDPDYVFTKEWRLRWDAEKETAYPSTFVVDQAGRIRFAKISKSHGDRAPVADVIKALNDL